MMSNAAAAEKRVLVSVEVKQLSITPEMLETYAKHVQKERTNWRVVPPEGSISEREKRTIIYCMQLTTTRKVEVAT